MRRARFLRIALALGSFGLLAVSRPPGLGDVHEVRHWSHAGYTRVVVELSRSTQTGVRRLAADPAAGRPDRLYFDLPGIWVGLRYREPLAIGDGLVRAVRVGQNTLTATRVVLDLAGSVEYRVLRLSAPDRIVIDVYGNRNGARPQSEPGSKPSLPVDLRPVTTVVVDPGHGGRDPGAVGVGGVREKDVTLAVARRLKEELETRGFRVVLTRTRDRTLGLEERTARAEGARGDVFVSLHANAARRRSAHGIEIYTLDETLERKTVRLAARENGISPGQVDALQRTLTRFRLSRVSERSTLLAELVEAVLLSDLARRWPAAQALRLRKGPFYVLYLSSMPSILVEVGFLTHRGEAKRLRKAAYLAALADGIAEGIARYRDRVAPVVAERRP